MTDVKPGPREARRAERIKVGREQVLDAAEELFGRHGYRGTSLAQVARRCEFSVGALYLFVESKEDLLRRVLERRAAELTRRMRECAATGGPAHEALARLARTQVAFGRRHPDFARLLARLAWAGADAAPGVAAEAARWHGGVVDVAAELLARGQADGTIRPGDPRGLARLFAAMMSAYHGLDPAVSPDGADLLDEGNFLGCISRAFAAPG